MNGYHTNLLDRIFLGFAGKRVQLMKICPHPMTDRFRV